jgi:hypothetical protein
MSIMNEGYLCIDCASRGPHKHSCEEPVKVTMLSLDAIRRLSYYCKNCGRVSDAENELCNPALLTPSGKGLFFRAATVRGGVAQVCQVCGQPVGPPGHICDPKGLPLECEFCNSKMETPYHVCSGIIENAKYVCQDCGRIAVRKESLCAPARIP